MTARFIKSKFRSMAAIAAVIVAMAAPSLANVLLEARATDSCTSYTITVTGTKLTSAKATVTYLIILTPTSGHQIIIADNVTVTRTDSAGDFSGTVTFNWSKYGISLTQGYTLTGIAQLDVGEESKVPIIFSQPSLQCGVITVGSCLPSSSLSILAQGKKVTSYVPNGSWNANNTGIQMVPLEPVGSPVSIATPNTVNSCSSNSVTGQTVCTANNTDVYVIAGTTLLSNLTSGANTFASFSGGDCENCGVAVNSNTNTAVITIGLSSAPSRSGLQYLNLASNTFATPVPANVEVSEDVLWDQNRNLILSPDEQGNYDLFRVAGVVTTEFTNPVGFGFGDSAAEDCSTGIALSSLEGTDQLYIADLTQATFKTGSPNTWTSAQQIQTFPEFGGFSAGTSGIAVAGASHLGIVTGEFGGNAFGAFQLPSTSGVGTPSVVDYAAAVLPNTPDGNVWSEGLDPHTVTAYVSPNTGKAYGVLANSDGVPPTFLAVIDLQALLNAPRLAGTHTVNPAFDLIANGVVTYVATH
jgi:hypothetical protein